MQIEGEFGSSWLVFIVTIRRGVTRVAAMPGTLPIGQTCGRGAPTETDGMEADGPFRATSAPPPEVTAGRLVVDVAASAPNVVPVRRSTDRRRSDLGSSSLVPEARGRADAQRFGSRQFARVRVAGRGAAASVARELALESRADRSSVGSRKTGINRHRPAETPVRPEVRTLGRSPVRPAAPGTYLPGFGPVGCSGSVYR